MVSPSGSTLSNLYDQVRLDIFGSIDTWTTTAGSGIPNSQFDIYAQKIASRIGLAVSEHKHVTLDVTAGTVSPDRDEIYSLLRLGIEALVKNTETSLLKRLSGISGAGMTVTAAEGLSVRNADGVQISNLSRYQERIRASLSDAKSAMEEFKQGLREYQYQVNQTRRIRYIW